MTYEEKMRDAKEFTSLLLSCELAVEFNKAKPNKAIKHALRSVKARVTSPNIKLLAQQGLQQAFPHGWLQRQLNNVGRFGGLSQEEFLRIGASL